MNTRRDAEAERAEVIAPRSRTEVQDTIHQAVELLKTQYSVGETSAYTILVQASVDAHLSVRDTARQIIDAARVS